MAFVLADVIFSLFAAICPLSASITALFSFTAVFTAVHAFVRFVCKSEIFWSSPEIACACAARSWTGVTIPFCRLVSSPFVSSMSAFPISIILVTCCITAWTASVPRTCTSCCVPSANFCAPALISFSFTLVKLPSVAALSWLTADWTWDKPALNSVRLFAPSANCCSPFT